MKANCPSWVVMERKGLLMESIEADRFIRWHRCAVCGKPPQRWPAPDLKVIVACLNPEHQGFVKEKGYYRQWREGQPVPFEVAQALEHKYGRRQDDLRRGDKLSGLVKQTLSKSGNENQVVSVGSSYHLDKTEEVGNSFGLLYQDWVVAQQKAGLLETPKEGGG